MRQSARSYFERGLEQRSPWPRAMAFAALGAAEVLAVRPAPRRRPAAAGRRRRRRSAGPADDPAWPWPERAADVRQRRARRGADRRRRAPRPPRRARRRPHAPCGGCSTARPSTATCRRPAPAAPDPDDRPPMFDQQPIEVAAMADACARADAVTGDPAGATASSSAVGWFLGANDVGVPMWDLERGGGYDGLAGRRRQPQPGRRVDAGADHDAAARSTRWRRSDDVPPAADAVVVRSPLGCARTRHACRRSAVRARARPRRRARGPGVGRRRPRPRPRRRRGGRRRSTRSSNGSADATGTSTATFDRHAERIANRVAPGRRAVRASDACCSAPRSPRSTPSRRPRCATRAPCRPPTRPVSHRVSCASC